MKGILIMPEIKNESRTAGILIMLISAICFSTSGIFFKFIPWSPLAINGARSLIGTIVIGLYIIISKHKLRVGKQIFFGAMCMFMTSALFSFANKMTSAANAIVLQFTMPVFVIIFMALIYKKKPYPSDIIACIGMIAGIVCFFIDGLSAGGTAGNLLALASGCTYAGVFMMNMAKNSDSISSVFWGMLLSAAVGIPFLPAETDFSPTVISAALAMGFIEIGMSYLLLAIGIKKTTPLAASLISGIEPILNPVLVAIFFHEMLSPVAFVGAALVVITLIVYNGAQAYMTASAKKHSAE